MAFWPVPFPPRKKNWGQARFGVAGGMFGIFARGGTFIVHRFMKIWGNLTRLTLKIDEKRDTTHKMMD